jgi:hypothetical protein
VLPLSHLFELLLLFLLLHLLQAHPDLLALVFLFGPFSFLRLQLLFKASEFDLFFLLLNHLFHVFFTLFAVKFELADQPLGLF